MSTLVLIVNMLCTVVERQYLFSNTVLSVYAAYSVINYVRLILLKLKNFQKFNLNKHERLANIVNEVTEFDIISNKISLL